MSNSIKFKRTLFGVSKKHVVDYMNIVSKNVEDKLLKKDKEIATLKSEKEAMQNTINEFEKNISNLNDEKEKISSVFLKAEQSAKNMINEAEENAQKLIDETNNKISEALNKLEYDKEIMAAQINAEIQKEKKLLEHYKNEIKIFREKIKTVLNSFDDVLESAIDNNK